LKSTEMSALLGDAIHAHLVSAISAR